MPIGTRGFYCYLPRPPDHPREDDRTRAHVDGWVNRCRLEAVAYFDDVPPGGGGFQCWPTSHHRCLNLTKVQPAPGDQTPTNLVEGGREVIDRLVGRLPQMDCHGKAGTVVLWCASPLPLPPPRPGARYSRSHSFS